MALRLVIQPLVAPFFGIRDGLRDHREGKAPYFWALFTNPEHRREMLLSGWRSIGKVFVVAIVVDLVFQHLVFREVRPMGAVLAGATLALAPWLRGPLNRLARVCGGRRES